MNATGVSIVVLLGMSIFIMAIFVAAVDVLAAIKKAMSQKAVQRTLAGAKRFSLSTLLQMFVLVAAVMTLIKVRSGSRFGDVDFVGMDAVRIGLFTVVIALGIVAFRSIVDRPVRRKQPARQFPPIQQSYAATLPPSIKKPCRQSTAG